MQLLGTIDRNFGTLASSDDFETLSIAMLKSMLASERLLTQEEAVYEALNRWLAARSPSVDDATKLELLSLIHFPLMEAKYLAEHVEGALAALDGGKDLLLEAYRVIALGDF